MQTEFLQSEQLPGLFIDALVTDADNNLLFLSAWGNESFVQQTRARLSLSDWEEQLRHFRLQQPAKNLTTGLISIDRTLVEDVTGRPAGNTLLAHVTQLWIYNRLTIAPDNANHRAVLLRRHTEEETQYKTRVWQALQVLCPIPLHVTWEFLLDKFVERGWVRFCRGFKIDACYLDFSNSAVELFITDQVQTGALTLPRLQ
ncbi:MAG TPA: hypothetical protein VHE99_02910 [Gammaproteobacteria bacterium]|nr:hypothetical protein [Gammaproteobacteria bacterium]HVY53386.1 hypothetical protein [Gammaproteobacteria bacterium]